MIQKHLPAVVVGTSGKLKPLLDITVRDVNNGTTKENWYIGKALGKERRMSKHPLDEHQEPWLWAHRQVGTYPESVYSGKWMLFIPDTEINEVWNIIRMAVEEGKLGNTAKVATAKPNANALDRHRKLICVYTYDAEDKEDVVRILQALRDLGFSQGLTYKTDEATIAREYSFNTAGPVSKYYAYKGTVDLSTPKGKSQKRRSRV